MKMTAILAAAITSWVSMGVVVIAGVSVTQVLDHGSPRGDDGGCCTATQEVPWRVWPLGDSITLGRTVINGQATDGVGGYRAKLPSKLTIKYEIVGTLQDVTGKHDGHSGWRADQIANEVRGWSAVTLPDVVILQVGTNDLGQGATAEQLNSRIEQIIQELRTVKRVWIYIAKLPPIPVNVGPRETQRQRFNDMLPAKAVEWGTKIFVVDQTDVALSPDGIHPSEPAGYDVVANHWATQLNKLPHLLR